MRKGNEVISKAGSDSGRVYLVVGHDDRGYALCVDGRRHGLAAPKSKNVRHLKETGKEVVLPKTDAGVASAIKRLDISS